MANLEQTEVAAWVVCGKPTLVWGVDTGVATGAKTQLDIITTQDILINLVAKLGWQLEE